MARRDAEFDGDAVGAPAKDEGGADEVDIEGHGGGDRQREHAPFSAVPAAPLPVRTPRRRSSVRPMYTWHETDPEDRTEVLRLIRELAGRHMARPGGRIIARALLAGVHLLEREGADAEQLDAAE